MKILVTGGAGFIGSHLIDRLLIAGNDVVCCDNLSLGRLSNLNDAMKFDKFKFIKADITDKNVFFKIFENITFDVVFHLAANSDIAKSHKNPNVDFDNTFLTTYNVLLAAKEFGIKNIVFASTSAIYGEAKTKIAENYGPLFPCSHYGASKLASEAFIASFCENYDIKAWIARFPNVVGERSTHGVIRDFILKLKKTPDNLEVLGDGEQCKPYLYVKDLIDALIFIWKNTDEKINYFNIGVNSSTKVKDIAKMVVEAVSPDAKITYTGGHRGWIGDVAKFEYDLTKINTLGWSASTTSDEAIKKAVKYILEVDKCSL